MVALADASALVGDVSLISIISWHSGKLHRTACSSCDAETQAASLAEEGPSTADWPLLTYSTMGAISATDKPAVA